MTINLSSNEWIENTKNNPNAVLIDVRTAEECAAGTIPNSININLMDPTFVDKIRALDKSKEYYVFCRSGGRSSSACGAMVSMGFENVHNLLGGMIDWTGDVVQPTR